MDASASRFEPQSHYVTCMLKDPLENREFSHSLSVCPAVKHWRCSQSNCLQWFGGERTANMRIQVTSLLAVQLVFLWDPAWSQGQDTSPGPRFTQPFYNTTIFENSAAKTYVEGPVKMGIYAMDPSWEIRYKIVSGDSESLFKAEEYQLGDFSFLRIRTKGGSSAILNREVRDHYVLTVKATERAWNAEARARVRVQVLDTNDLRPLFSPTSYSVSLPENTAIRSSIATVTATDADIGTNGEYYYSFREWTDTFAVHPTSGVVTLTGKLDYAETRRYELEVLAVDRGMKLYGSSGFSSMAKLTVRVEQANEHAPVITALALVSSDADKDPTYAVVSVEDDDQGANGEIASLSVVAGDPLQQFRAVRSSPGSKEYKIRALKEVDWVGQPYGYNLTLQAKDKGNPARFSSAKVIHITSPQFKVGPPKFEQSVYRVNISEFAPLRTPVVMVTAVPKYPQLKYTLRQKSDKNPFTINPDTGLITTAGPVRADYAPRHELEVFIGDKKGATKVIVDVTDVNNNAPEFQQSSYKASVDENMPIGTSVATVKAVDLDSGENGYVTYSIANVNPQPFAIDYFSGVISTSELLDYELMPRVYNLRVRASDWGEPFRREVEMQVTVTLSNLNDNKPLFESVDCEVTVPRDHGVGEQITTVSAIDADELQLVRYAIRSGNGLDLFELNPNSGVLSLKQPLDEGEAVKASFHCLQVVASDGEHEAPPTFLNITVITAHKPVQVRCVDTGVATMLAEKLLQSSRVHNQAEPDENFLDVHAANRFTPQFADSFPSAVDVKEDLPVGARIIHLNASDSDSGFNGKLVYVISGGDTESRFVVDMNDGWLKVYAPLDRERTDHYTLNVTVYDLGIPQKSSSRLLDVKVTDANDNSPRFLQDTYSVEISENTPVGTEIIQVVATDKDLGDNGIVRYSILADTDQFTIAEETGIVTVKKPLDREVQSDFLLRIAARDQATAEPQLVSTVSLKITLEDVNDNPPKFVPPNYRVKVREDLPIGTVVMWLEAHDPDIGPSSQVRYSLMDHGEGKFEVDKLSGAVRIVQNLDYEKRQVYNLMAKAKDKGKPISLSSTCHVEVEVVDVNENLHRPWFPSFVDKGFIKEDIPIGTSVMKVTAQDEDKGRDGEIVYSIRDGSGLGIFAIDEETATGSDTRYRIATRYAGRIARPWCHCAPAWRLRLRPDAFPLVDAREAVGLQSRKPRGRGTELLPGGGGGPDRPHPKRVRAASRWWGESHGVFSKAAMAHEVRQRFLASVSQHPPASSAGPSSEAPPLPSPASSRGGAELVCPMPDNRGMQHGSATACWSGPAVARSNEPRGRGCVTVPTGGGDEREVGFVIIELVKLAHVTGQQNTTCHAGLIGVEFERSSPRRGEADRAAIGGRVWEGRARAGRARPHRPAPRRFRANPGHRDLRRAVRRGARRSRVIRTLELLDHETTPHYWLTAYACDRGAVPLCASVEVYVEVQDVNDNAPQTPEPVYYPSIAENSPKDVSVIRIEAVDPDTGSGDGLTYRITSGNPQGFFSINAKTEVIPSRPAPDAGMRRVSLEAHESIVRCDGPRSPSQHHIPKTGPRTAGRTHPRGDDHGPGRAGPLLGSARDRDRAGRERQPSRLHGEGVQDQASGAGSGQNGQSGRGRRAAPPVYRVLASDRDAGPNAELSYSIEDGDEQGRFFIEPKTGLVSSKKFSSSGEYDILTIKAVDNGRPQKSSTCRLHIEWVPKPQPSTEPLAFDESIFSFTVMESDPVAHMVGVITMEKVDSPVWFEITGGNTDSRLDVGRASGTLVVARPLDAEQKTHYNLTVEATDGTRTASTQVSVFRYASVFTLTFSSTRSVITVNKLHPVTSLMRPAVNSPRRSTARNIFPVADAILVPFCALLIDRGRVTLILRVLVRVIDANDHRPEFTQPRYEVTVREDVAPATEVLRLSATDRDEKNKLTFTLLSSTDPFSLRKFRLDPGTGVLYTADRLDHETMRQHTLTVMVRDQDIPVKRNLVRVIVHVEDTNDNAPWFAGAPYAGRAFESAAAGSVVLQVTALDKDEGQNAEIVYSIESGNVANSFAIDPILGTIAVAKELDRSTKEHFELIIKASDQGIQPLSATATATITVTVSDNAKPKFAEKEFSAEVSEAALPGTFVSLVACTSQSSVFYQIKDGNVNGAFDVNPNSGVVVTQRALDYETIPSYKLTIQGTNMASLASNVTLMVHLKDENDNVPVFVREEFTGMVSESSPIRSVVLTKDSMPLVVRATDADRDANARLVYQIVEPFALNYFAIDSSTGAIRTTTELDYEKKSIFHFSVQVHDMGIPRHFANKAANVTIEVIDVNDCPPRFSQDSYETTVLVPTYKGVEVVIVSATDEDSGPNARLLYSVVEGNIGDKFKMDPVIGVVTIQNVTQLRSRYELRVRVSDGRFSETASVKITVRENKAVGLRFTQSSYRATVQENSAEKTTLAIIAAVGIQVNEPLFYAILNPDRRFEIGHTSGVLLTTGVPFDHEEQDTYEVIVEVSKQDKSSDVAHVLVTVTVEDANDNLPMFVNLPYHALVRKDAEAGQVIRHVTAVDADAGSNAQIKYHLREWNEYIQISPSGELSLKTQLDWDSPDSEFSLTVVATDGGEPPLSATVEVPVTIVTKAIPVFERPFYSLELPENVQLNTPIVHVQANDSEGPRVVYTIAEGDPYGQFSISFGAGVISVGRPLDFEAHPAYKLSVWATDALTGAKAEVFVDIILEDMNDNPPIFLSKFYNASVSEASVVGTRRGAVEDEDQSSECFAVDRDTGTIWTVCALDREEKSQHKLIVRAVDGGVPALSSEVTVTIDVTDLNDNAPVFSQGIYEAAVSELAPRGHFVTQVRASDADSSDRGKLEFSILSGNEEQNFAMDRVTGTVVISNHRKPHMESLYSLNVSVSDGVFRNSALVKVSVIGANFQNPAFPQVDYIVELLENSPVGILVAEAQASDEDAGTYGQLTYHIVNDVAKDKFSVSEKGEIFTLESLDRENALEKVIPISLMAKDGGGKVGFCTINVILTDINDNSPQFRAAEYRANIASDVPRGTTVVTIAASDMDEGSNADITYTVEADSDNVAENFEIHPVTGVIMTKESLIGLENELYSFLVRAKDGGNPSRFSVVPVHVRVLAPEVRVPKFTEPHYSLAKGNTQESNKEEVFVVDRDTGALKLEKKLDHETTKWYQLTLCAQSEHEGSEVISSVDISIQVKDINDNRPLFESDPYKAVVAENLPGGTSVIQVKATDLDSGTNGLVVYSLDPIQQSADIGELFAIHSETGWVMTLRELDRELKSKYTIAVLATDRGDKIQLTASTKVDVMVADVNDNPPRFTAEIYKGTVSEDDPPGGVIAILSTTDADSEGINKQVEYFITGGDPLGQFGVEHAQGEWKVSVQKSLDREETDNYLLNVTATDGTFTARAVVEVKVLDANDNSPVCGKSLYTERVPEDSAPGRLVLQVSATDADIRSNAHISYQMLGAGSQHFTLDPDTGTDPCASLGSPLPFPLFSLSIRHSGFRYFPSLLLRQTPAFFLPHTSRRVTTPPPAGCVGECARIGRITEAPADRETDRDVIVMRLAEGDGVGWCCGGGGGVVYGQFRRMHGEMSLSGIESRFAFDCSAACLPSA
ncbi:hypothetical protein P4O66_012453, partial [Electrophorus voltai]